MKQKDRDTDENSLKRIWVKKDFAEHYFDYNNQINHNSIDATIKFLEEVREKAQRQGYEDVVIEPYRNEDDGEFDTLGIVANGWRFETEDEWKQRLGWNKSRKAREVERLMSEVVGERLKRLQNQIAELDKALKKT